MKIINQLPDHYLEHDYFNKMFQFLDKEILKDKTIYISHNYQFLPEYGKNVIAILTAGDEKGKPPAYSDKVQYVFKHHLDEDSIGNVYHIPLPYNTKFSGNAKIPIRDREHDIFFAGCRRGNRTKFVNELKHFMQKRKHDYKFCVKITGKFGTGFGIKQYSQIMSNSKIIMSPQGWVRPECIRYSEGVRCGCAIIADTHAPLTCFENTPYYDIKNWTCANIDRAVRYCMDNIEDIHEETKQSWNDYFRPQAIAYKINNVVGGK